ncbi:MAG: hypothetical protein ABIP93_08695 [Gemmatimonadaceae bacterium]
MLPEAYVVPSSALPSGTLTLQDVTALRARRSELNSQLDAANRNRRQLSEQLRRAEGANKAGLETRLAALDGRIARMEGEIDAVGQRLASVDAARYAETRPPFTPGPRNNPFNNVRVEPIAIAFTLFVLSPIAISMSRLIWKRGSRMPVSAPAVESTQRLERMEQAMDAIAIEIERVSEGQRFVTRLLSERGGAALGAAQPAAEPLRVPLGNASKSR